MIVFDLKCGQSHIFEAWFDSSSDYEAQKARGLVAGWRFGAHASGRSRLVVDTRGPVRLARAEVDRATPSGLPRLVVELVPASPEEMRAAATVDLPADPVICTRLR